MAVNATLNLHNAMEKHHIAYWFCVPLQQHICSFRSCYNEGYTDEILYAERNPLFQIENVLFTVILLAIKRRKTTL